MNRWDLVRVLPVLMGCLLAGCSTVFPAHPRSNDRDDEVTTLVLEENAAPEVTTEFLAGAPVLVGMAIDRLRQALEQEAALYEAQFGAKRTEASFWRTNRKPKWTGLHLTRDTARSALDGHAFDLECSLQQVSPDSNLFTLVPQSLEVRRSRAKILSVNYWPWAMATWFSETGSTVELEVQLDVEGAWVDESVAHVESLGSVTLPKIAYNLDRTTKMGKGELARYGSEPFVGIPAKDGAVTFHVSVIERDPKNCKQLIEKLAAKVGDYKPVVLKKLGGGGGGGGPEQAAVKPAVKPQGDAETAAPVEPSGAAGAVSHE